MNLSEGLKKTLGITEETGMSPEELFDAVSDPHASAGGEDLSGYEQPPRDVSVFVVKEMETSVPDLVSSDAKVDYVAARNHTYTLIEMSTQALARALDVAKETEHPRAFESFNSLVTTTRGLVQDLLAMQKAFADITKGRIEMETPPPPVNQTQINGDVHLNSNSGSTQSVIDLLNQAIEAGQIKPMVNTQPKPPE